MSRLRQLNDRPADLLGPVVVVTYRRVIYFSWRPPVDYITSTTIGRVLRLIGSGHSSYMLDDLYRRTRITWVTIEPKYAPLRTPYCNTLRRMMHVELGSKCMPVIGTRSVIKHRWVTPIIKPMHSILHKKRDVWASGSNPMILGTKSDLGYWKASHTFLSYAGLSIPSDMIGVPVDLVLQDTTHNYDINDIYRRVSNGVSKIAPDLTSTEANLLVTMLEGKQILMTFSLAALRLASPLGMVAAAWLQYNFAIAPTIDDAKKLLALNEKMHTAIKKWNSQAGKTRFVHIDCGTNNSTTIETVTKNYLTYEVHTDVKEHRRATLQIVGNRIKYPSSMIWLRKLGFDKPLSALWELIPFSFIVDWFYDLSGLIDSIERADSPAYFVVKDAQYSVKKVVVRKYTNFRINNDYYMYDPNWSLYVEDTLYSRSALSTQLLNDRSFMDEIGAWLPSSRFGLKQASLLTALGITLRPSLRRS